MLQEPVNSAAWIAAAVSLTVLISVPAMAGEPCTPRWDNAIGLPGLPGLVVVGLTVYEGEVIAGGSFGSAGGNPAANIASWDGSSWKEFGQGMNNWVQAVTVYDGDLVATGGFTEAGGVAANYIARWNASEGWQPFGSGIAAQGTVITRAMVEYNGDLIVGGFFNSAGGMAVNNIARWDNATGTWRAMGTGVNGMVRSLTVYNGELIAGGFFDVAGGVTVNRIARWNGTSWQALGTGVQHGAAPAVDALVAFNGDLIAGGNFSSAGGVPAAYIARWDGSSWHAMGSGMNNKVEHLNVYNGELIAGGEFTTAGGAGVNRIARWNGSSWQSLGGSCPGPVGGGCGLNNSAIAMAQYEGELIVGGAFTIAFGLPVENIASWDACLEPDPGIPGDLNGDGFVNVFDLLILLEVWGDCKDVNNCPADLNGDGAVNVFDLLILLENWG